MPSSRLAWGNRRFVQKTVSAMRGTGDLALRVILILIATVAVTAPALLVRYGPHVVVVHGHVIRTPRRHIVPRAELPTVEPVTFQNLTPTDARAYNATMPFSDQPSPAARPFHLTGTPDQQARATDCMAAAMLYEAGDDNEGQRAVGQVIINRVRHPAFPKTICGVVFQGSERSTGCQFTFTCDGALVRHGWRPEQWARARTQAVAALSGTVFAAVGYSTHYHTDWVVPYWQSSLDKVAAVHTHLFFRWSGWWGTPPAFNRVVSSEEPIIPALAFYSGAHRGGGTLVLATAASAAAELAALTPEALPMPLSNDAETFLVTIDPHLSSDTYPIFATKVCGERQRCKLMAWTDKARTPSKMPLDAGEIDAMAFSYMRDRTYHYNKALWNCVTFKRADPGECMKTQVLLPRDTKSAAVSKTPAAAATPLPADTLTGVRNRPAPSSLQGAAATPAKAGSPVSPDGS